MTLGGRGGASRPLCTPCAPYLQGQLQAQVFRVAAEHGPGGAEEDVVHRAVRVLDVTLWGPGLGESLRVHACARA